MEHSISETSAPVQLPRITIQFCTQCKWMLRAAYFAQELLSTFSTSLGEVALIPSTGGVFTINIVHAPVPTSSEDGDNANTRAHTHNLETKTTQLWDRKTEGGFPEVKHLKQLVRNIIDPTRDLGHVDRHTKATSSTTNTNTTADIPSSSVPQEKGEDPKASGLWGLHVGVEPVPAKTGSAIGPGEKMVDDDSASRNENIVIASPDTGIVGEGKKGRGGARGDCEDCA